MRITIVKNRLRAARQSWAKSEVSPDVASKGNFVTGVLQGLREALHIVEQSQREDIKKARGRRRPLSRWTGLLLYTACRQAYGRLKQGDRAKAMRILSDVINQVSL
jgi:hypothetical protein